MAFPMVEVVTLTVTNVEYRSSFQESLCTAKGRRSRISMWDSSGMECSMVGASTIPVTGASSQV